MQTQIEIAIPLELLTDADLAELRRRAIASGFGQTVRRLEKQILARKVRAAVAMRQADQSRG